LAEKPKLELARLMLKSGQDDGKAVPTATHPSGITEREVSRE